MSRTTSALVQELLGTDYDSVRAPSLTPRIDSATVIVDRVATCAVRKGWPLSDVELELIERWLAAHLYTKTDPTYASKSTEGASGNFVRSPVEPEPYKDGALALDSSGCLDAILNRKRASAFWLGKTASEQLTWEERN